MNQIWVLVNSATGVPLDHPAGGLRAYHKEGYAKVAAKSLVYGRTKLTKIVRYVPVTENE